MVAHATRFFADLTLGPGDERVEASVQIPEGFTPEMLEIDGWGAVRPDTPPSVDDAAVKAMHCSLIVAVRFDGEPIFQAPFGHLPARLSAGEARSLTILIERHDRPGMRERERRVERDETWRMRAWISGMQEGYAEPAQPRNAVEAALDRYRDAVRATQSVLDEPFSNAERHVAKVEAERAIEEKERQAVLDAVSRLALGTT